MIDTPSSPRVLVVGAGMSGLQTVAALLHQAGIRNVVCLEQLDEVGGTILNKPRCLHVPWPKCQLLGYPWPSSLQPAGPSTAPSVQAYRSYLHGFVQHMGLMQHIKLSCKLLHLKLENGCTWVAAYMDGRDGMHCQLEADFVVLCTGRHSCPNVPVVPGVSYYQGTQVHAHAFTDPSAARGRSVVVVGGGQSALDIMSQLALTQAPRSLVMLYRQAHWLVPADARVRQQLLSQSMAQKAPWPYYTAGKGSVAGLASKLTHAMSLPFRRAFWGRLTSKLVEAMGGAQQAGVSGSLLTAPTDPLTTDLTAAPSGDAYVVDATWPMVMRAKRYRAVQGELVGLSPSGCLLKDGTELQADLVVYATGYAPPSYSELFDPWVAARIMAASQGEEGPWLYRHVLPPGVPNLALVGCEARTPTHSITSGLQAAWVAGLLCARVRLPSLRAMWRDVELQAQWMRQEVLPAHPRGRASALGPLFMHQYHEQLLSDLGCGVGTHTSAGVGRCVGGDGVGDGADCDDLRLVARLQPPHSSQRARAVQALQSLLRQALAADGMGGMSLSNQYAGAAAVAADASSLPAAASLMQQLSGRKMVDANGAGDIPLHKQLSGGRGAQHAGAAAKGKLRGSSGKGAGGADGDEEDEDDLGAGQLLQVVPSTQGSTGGHANRMASGTSYLTYSDRISPESQSHTFSWGMSDSSVTTAGAATARAMSSCIPGPSSAFQEHGPLPLLSTPQAALDTLTGCSSSRAESASHSVVSVSAGSGHAALVRCQSSALATSSGLNIPSPLGQGLRGSGHRYEANTAAAAAAAAIARAQGSADGGSFSGHAASEGVASGPGTSGSITSSHTPSANQLRPAQPIALHTLLRQQQAALAAGVQHASQLQPQQASVVAQLQNVAAPGLAPASGTQSRDPGMHAQPTADAAQRSCLSSSGASSHAGTSSIGAGFAPSARTMSGSGTARSRLLHSSSANASYPTGAAVDAAAASAVAATCVCTPPHTFDQELTSTSQLSQPAVGQAGSGAAQQQEAECGLAGTRVTAADSAGAVPHSQQLAMASCTDSTPQAQSVHVVEEMWDLRAAAGAAGEQAAPSQPSSGPGAAPLVHDVVDLRCNSSTSISAAGLALSGAWVEPVCAASFGPPVPAVLSSSTIMPPGAGLMAVRLYSPEGFASVAEGAKEGHDDTESSRRSTDTGSSRPHSGATSSGTSDGGSGERASGAGGVRRASTSGAGMMDAAGSSGLAATRPVSFPSQSAALGARVKSRRTHSATSRTREGREREKDVQRQLASVFNIRPVAVDMLGTPAQGGNAALYGSAPAAAQYAAAAMQLAASQHSSRTSSRTPSRQHSLAGGAFVAASSLQLPHGGHQQPMQLHAAAHPTASPFAPLAIAANGPWPTRVPSGTSSVGVPAGMAHIASELRTPSMNESGLPSQALIMPSASGVTSAHTSVTSATAARMLLGAMMASGGTAGGHGDSSGVHQAVGLRTSPCGRPGSGLSSRSNTQQSFTAQLSAQRSQHSMGQLHCVHSARHSGGVSPQSSFSSIHRIHSQPGAEMALGRQSSAYARAARGWHEAPMRDGSSSSQLHLVVSRAPSGSGLATGAQLGLGWHRPSPAAGSVTPSGTEQCEGDGHSIEDASAHGSNPLVTPAPRAVMGSSRMGDLAALDAAEASQGNWWGHRGQQPTPANHSSRPIHMSGPLTAGGGIYTRHVGSLSGTPEATYLGVHGTGLRVGSGSSASRPQRMTVNADMGGWLQLSPGMLAGAGAPNVHLSGTAAAGFSLAGDDLDATGGESVPGDMVFDAAVRQQLRAGLAVGPATARPTSALELTSFLRQGSAGVSDTRVHSGMVGQGAGLGAASGMHSGGLVRLDLNSLGAVQPGATGPAAASPMLSAMLHAGSAEAAADSEPLVFHALHGAGSGMLPAVSSMGHGSAWGSGTAGSETHPVAFEAAANDRASGTMDRSSANFERSSRNSGGGGSRFNAVLTRKYGSSNTSIDPARISSLLTPGSSAQPLATGRLGGPPSSLSAAGSPAPFLLAVPLQSSIHASGGVSQPGSVHDNPSGNPGSMSVPATPDITLLGGVAVECGMGGEEGTAAAHLWQHPVQFGAGATPSPFDRASRCSQAHATARRPSDCASQSALTPDLPPGYAPSTGGAELVGVGLMAWDMGQADARGARASPHNQAALPASLTPARSSGGVAIEGFGASEYPGTIAYLAAAASQAASRADSGQVQGSLGATGAGAAGMDWNRPVSGSGVRGAAVGWAGNSNSQGVMRNSKGSTGGLMGSSRVSAAGAAVAASGGLLGPGVGVGASAGVRSTGARASGTPPQAGGDSLAHLRMLETMASNASIAPDEVWEGEERTTRRATANAALRGALLPGRPSLSHMTGGMGTVGGRSVKRSATCTALPAVPGQGASGSTAGSGVHGTAQNVAGEGGGRQGGEGAGSPGPAGPVMPPGSTRIAQRSQAHIDWLVRNATATINKSLQQKQRADADAAVSELPVGILSFEDSQPSLPPNE